jgi:hypothetical protein
MLKALEEVRVIKLYSFSIISTALFYLGQQNQIPPYPRHPFSQSLLHNREIIWRSFTIVVSKQLLMLQGVLIHLPLPDQTNLWDLAKARSI